MLLCLFFFFKQKTAYEMRISDWSSDVCSSDLLIDEERVTVTEKGFLDSLETITANIALGSAASITVTDGTAFTVGEVILIDVERMLVTDINGTTLGVKRAWDGTTLAAHTSGASVLAQRRLTVRRAVLGTVASTPANDADRKSTRL